MPPSPDLVAERIAAVRATVPTTVTLIAVTKQVSVDLMTVAYEMGLRDFGESKVQEAAQKQAQLDLPGIRWHLIGHLQRNKAGKAIQQFDWIHSLDSLRLAERLNHVAAEAERVP
ncbi:MAG: alanine racemase, partial [Cyanobacteria bacterium P01_A01_bin.135]